MQSVRITPRTLRLASPQAHARPTLPNTPFRCAACQQRAYTLRRFVPRFLEPDTWRAMVPKPWRRRDGPGVAGSSGRRPRTEWNPSTVYIVYGLLIGSQAIHTLTLKRDMATFGRRTEAKLELLREVVQRVQAGEEVDVEAALGTGDPLREKEWDEVMREIEQEDAAFTASQRRRAEQDASDTPSAEIGSTEESEPTANKIKAETPKRPGPVYY